MIRESYKDAVNALGYKAIVGGWKYHLYQRRGAGKQGKAAV